MAPSFETAIGTKQRVLPASIYKKYMTATQPMKTKKNSFCVLVPSNVSTHKTVLSSLHFDALLWREVTRIHEGADTQLEGHTNVLNAMA